ncbi:YqgQ family protein [Bacillus rubiinfantis]|uniref:YqgQ family protein n=1 Tax=Bacillus rubiinfantis TaxID=1499680 RepID=UPI0005A837FA|nr:YqgQ family protein [Bacillus rubiinfantis]
MKSVYEIQQYLKRFGTIIYVGDRIGNLELMEAEIKELYQSQIMEPQEYQTAILILRHEIQMLKDQKKEQS